MKTIAIILALICWSHFLLAEGNEPCKGVILPSEIHSTKIIFEMPTYDEYVHDMVMKSFVSGSNIDDDNILDQSVFTKVRKQQIKIIKDSYQGAYEFKTSKEVKALKTGFVFRHSYITDLVSSISHKFENYMAFSIENLDTNTAYTLVNPQQSGSTNCIVKKGEYRFEELIESIQK